MRWREDLANGGSKFDKMQIINAVTFERFKESRSRLEQVNLRNNTSETL